MSTKEEFKIRLKKALEERNMKAVDLSHKTEIPKSAISYYLSGKSEPKADRIYQISKALDVNESWLLGYSDNMDRPYEQKKNDEMVDLINRIKKDQAFRSIIYKINTLNPDQLEAIKIVLSAFPAE